MIKIYQNIVNKNHGNCMQAAIASLFEEPLENVPNFIELKNGWFSELCNFLKKRGYAYDGMLHSYGDNKRLYPNEDAKDRFNEIKEMEGVNGYFYAAVYSPKYYNPTDVCPITHAVIIDKNFNIVHDVNKEYNNCAYYPEASAIGYNGIVYIFMINPVLK